MSLRRVRCPHCSRRFDVTGVKPGTLLRCGGCGAVLSVPAVPPSRPLPVFRIAGATAAGLATLVVLALALRPSPAEPPSTAEGAAVMPVPAAPAPAAGDSGLGIIDDPVSRLRQELGRDYPGSRFTFSDSVRPYMLILESSERYVDRERIREYGQQLEFAHAAFRRDVAERIGLPAVTDTVLPVLVLASRAAFDRHCERFEGKRQPEKTKAYYDYARRRIVTYQDSIVPREVILHEGAHQLMHYYQLRQAESRKVHVSFWLQEGLANYCEGLRRRVDGEILLDRSADSQRFPLLRFVAAPQDRAEFVPLATLVELSVDDYWERINRLRMEDPNAADREAQILYAEAWALVHFLRQSGPKHRRVFEQVMRRELSGSSSKTSFAEVVRGELELSLRELEAQFLKYVQSMK